MLLVVFALLALVGVGALFVHALRSDPSPNGDGHGWLVVLPLVVIFGWVIEQIITG